MSDWAGWVLRLAAACAAFAVTTTLTSAAARPGAADPVARRAGAPPDWRTPAEASDYRTTPRYEDTLAYLERIRRAAPGRVRIESFGKTGEGRDLHVVLVSRDGVFDPAALRRAGRPVVLIQNAIHAGEMDGKDACLELLRDLVVTRSREALLRKTVLLMVPIYNADGHERFGPHNRINQNGPEEMGWRTQARNLNLNRDYLKADAPETRAFLALWNRWLPDFYVDNHVTDGADYAYDTTYALETGPDMPQALARWSSGVLAPYLEESVTRAGHSIAPYLLLQDETDPARGTVLTQSQPRYSTGWAILQDRPAMLVEMHMLKDYRTRVRGNYEILRALLEVIDRDADLLVTMNRKADETTIAAGRAPAGREPFPLRLDSDGTTETMAFRIRRYRREPSAVSGATRIVYAGEYETVRISRQNRLRVILAVSPPRAYIVPAPWTPVIDVLRAQGLRLRETAASWSGEVGTYRCDPRGWLATPFEGRQVLFFPAGESVPMGGAPGLGCRAGRDRLTFPAGSIVVPLDQRAAKVAIHFLEPEGPDSAVAWGFFNALFEQKEYAEPYVMERVAREMMERDPGLRAAFERRIADDPAFAADPRARLDFFYRRSPFWDSRLGLYPVGRLDSLEGVPLRADGTGHGGTPR